jgi:preprotein translocase subunit SecD
VFAARFRGAAYVSIAVLGIAFSSVGAAAEPLRLFFSSVSAGIPDPQTNWTILNIRLIEESRLQFARFTSGNLGHKIDVRIGGKTVLSPVVREPIVSGVMPVPIREPEEARRLVEFLSGPTGSLEVEAASN